MLLPARLALSCLLVATLATTLHAADDDDGSDDRIAALEKQVLELTAAYRDLVGVANELRAQVSTLSAGAAAGAAAAPQDDEFFIPMTAQEFQATGLPQNFGGIYTKPFLSRFGDDTYIGGYIDLEYTNPTGGGGNQEFDQHRFVPFIYADVTDKVKVAAEIELEHGSEVEVEFAQMDFLFNKHANFRAGIQLLPLGKFNEVHDSPIQELTYRPLVDQYIIPTTLRDAGIGMYGEVTETVSYQTTITNGFRGLGSDGTNAITQEKGLRNAAPYKDVVGEPYQNDNNKLAYTGRLAWRPELGLEFGASGMWDTYDEDGNNGLEILALDATIDGKAVPMLPDNMELLYEGAWADVERDAFALASGVAGDMNGYYAQANVHFEPDFLGTWRKEGGFADDGAHFTFVTRYGHVDLDGYSMRRTTLGLNYRPNESQTVIKLDYQLNDDSGDLQGTNDNNAVVVSFASYF